MNRDISWLFEKPIAHRGMRFDDIPENSLTSFKEAVNAGLVIELDVQVLRDGTVVVFHDFDTLRMTRKPGMVMSYSLKGIKKLRLKGSDEQVPTLKEVLDLVDGKVGLLIELKVMLSYKKLCNSLLKTLKGYKGKVALQGFSQRAIAYIRKNSDYPVGIIGMDYRKTGLVGFYGHWLNSVAYFDRINPDFLNYNHMHIPSPTTRRFTEHGIPIIAWTIRSQKQFDGARGRCCNVIVETKDLEREVLGENFNASISASKTDVGNQANASSGTNKTGVGNQANDIKNKVDIEKVSNANNISFNNTNKSANKITSNDNNVKSAKSTSKAVLDD